MKKIELSKNGKYKNTYKALVDDEDYELLNQYNWSVQKSEYTCYAVTNIDGFNVRMHRIILNPPKDMEIDHIDGNGLNNQKSNIRICTHSENQKNTSPRGKSKYLGVTLHTTKKIYYCKKINDFKEYKSNVKWLATININGKQKHLGHHDTEIEAAIAYDEAAKLYHGEFANLNFKTVII